MKTAHLISTLSQDALFPATHTKRLLCLAILSALTFMCLFFVFFLTLRADFSTLFLQKPFLLKIGFTISVALFSGIAFYQGYFPERKPQFIWPLLPFFVLLLFITVSLFFPPLESYRPLAQTTWKECLLLVPTLALCGFVPLFSFMRTGAPIAPTQQGALLGFFCAGMGASIYAFHCIDDAPLFILLAYGGACLLSALLGAFLGRFYLRW